MGHPLGNNYGLPSTPVGQFSGQRHLNPYGSRDMAPVGTASTNGQPPRGYLPPYRCPYGPSVGMRPAYVLLFNGDPATVADGATFVVRYGVDSTQSLTLTADVSNNSPGPMQVPSWASGAAMVQNMVATLNAGMAGATSLGLVAIADYNGTGKPAIGITDKDCDFETANPLSLDTGTGGWAASQWSVIPTAQGEDPCPAVPVIQGYPGFMAGAESVTC